MKWPAAKSKQIVEFVRTLERAADMRKLVGLCSV